MSRSLRNLASGAALFLLTVTSAWAEETYELDIADQQLSGALKQFAEQSGLQVVYFAAVAEGKEAPAVHGEYSATDALDRLLANADLTYTTVDDRTYAIAAPAAAVGAGGDSDSGNGRPAGATPRPVMMAQAVAEQSQTSRRTETDSDEDEQKRPLEEIIVTGTNIRGIAPESSPVRIFDREDIQISGAATAQDFIRTLTMNFGGGVSEFTGSGLPNDQEAVTNASFGSSVNLRGLGSSSTLVLLNGHRLAPSSSVGNITDISMIPASAIDRVEVLTDGASSIYGSDAVAGVTNFILRDDFEGVEASLRYGIGTQNNAPEDYRASITGGGNWGSGHGLVSYEYFDQSDIGVQDRSYTQGALPPGDIQPSQKRHSMLATISQDLTSNLGVFADVAFSRRESHRDSRNLLVDNLLVQDPASKNLSLAAGGSWKVSDTWFLDFSGTYGKSYILNNAINSSGFNSNDFNSETWASDIRLSGTVLRLPGGDLKLAFGGHFRTEDFDRHNLLTNSVTLEADRDVYAAFGEAFIPIVGPDNAVPGLKRLELNVSGRFDDYSDFGSTANPKVGVLWSPAEGLRLRGSYSTSFNPPPIGTPQTTAVVAFNTAFLFPEFGITPADSSLADTIYLTVLGPDKNLGPETSRAFTAGVDFDHAWNGHEIAFSTTWFDIDFDDRLGTTPIPNGGSPFEVLNIAFNDPGAFPEGTVILSPTMDQISAVVDSADFLTANSPPFTGDPFDASAIEITQVTRNLSRSIVSGLDFSAGYTCDSGVGSLNFGIDGTYLLEFKQQAASTTPVFSLINTQFHPVDLRLRGHAGYSNNGFAANLFVNYVDSYRVDNTIGAEPIDSWTTVDLSLSYDTRRQAKGSLLDDTIFRLSVINLFDRDPPTAPTSLTFRLVGYDPTNASPLGRFIAFQVTKRF